MSWRGQLACALFFAPVALGAGPASDEARSELVRPLELPDDFEHPLPYGAPLALEALEVTEGALTALGDGALLVESPKMRAVALSGRARAASLRITWLGPTEEQAPLRSGELRQQVGLKLRARDGCNLVYVMWRLSPAEGLSVQVKRNPGEERSIECGNGGYRTIAPERRAPFPAMVPGEERELTALLSGERLTVRIDGRAVWEGQLGKEALSFDGPIGLRSDNGKFLLELRGR